MFILAYDHQNNNFKNEFNRSINNINEYRFCILDKTELKFASLKSARCVRSHFNTDNIRQSLSYSEVTINDNVSDKHIGYYHSTVSDKAVNTFGTRGATVNTDNRDNAVSILVEITDLSVLSDHGTWWFV